MNATVVTANQADHQEILSNLLNLYLHDLSEFFDIKADENGWFDYDYDWHDPCSFAFIAYQNSLPVGFALVTKGSILEPMLKSGAEVWDMHEFFVLRPYRRSGLGLWLAREMYRKFPGRWEIRVGEKNTGALAFWRNSLVGINCTRPDEAFLGDIDRFYCIRTIVS